MTTEPCIVSAMQLRLGAYVLSVVFALAIAAHSARPYAQATRDDDECATAGQRLTRAQRLEMFRSGQMRIERYARDQETSQRRVTNVLAKKGGRWRAVFQHSTLIQQP